MRKPINNAIPIQLIEDNIVGNIKIDKININKPLYSINSPQNNVDKNITILKESNYPEIMFIAAHSGTGEIAYFNNLDYLDINDEVTIEYLNDKRTYQVKEKNIQIKNGYINITKNEYNTLILTTCYPYNDKYQLIVSCKEKES